MTRALARALTGALIVALTAALLAGCAQQPTESETQGGSGEPAPTGVRIGVLPTEDSLPLWVAEDKGYFEEAGLESVEIVVFQSAQERDAAFASGAVDGFMGDLIAAANLEAGGSPARSSRSCSAPTRRRAGSESSCRRRATSKA